MSSLTPAPFFRVSVNGGRGIAETRALLGVIKRFRSAAKVSNENPCLLDRPEEVALRRKMIALGISIWEPDPLAAITKAEAERAKTAAK